MMIWRFIWKHVSVLHSFSKLLQFCCIDGQHFVYPSVSWWAFGLFPFFWWLWIMLLGKFIYKFWGKHIFSFLLCVYPGYTITSCLLFWGIAKLISKWLHHFTFFPAMLRVPVFQQPYQYVLLSLIIAVLVDVKWYFIVVLICFSLMTTDTEHFSGICWAFVSILGGKKSFQIFCPFLNWIKNYFCHWVL